jgi:AcrR family transcriptional regulator
MYIDHSVWRKWDLIRGVMRGIKTGDVKVSIIEESIKLFLSNGYKGTSVKSITESAAIGRGTLYWYFKSKDEILISIFEKWEKEFVQSLINAVNDREGNFVAKYRAFHKYATEFGRDHRELAIVFNTLINEIVGTNTEVERVAKKAYGKFREFAERMLEDGKRDGSVRPDLNSNVYAHVIIACHMAMAVEWHVFGEALDVGPFVRAFRDMILRSVAEG